MMMLAGTAWAEEPVLEQGELELFASGGLPESYGIQVYSNTISEFNSYVKAELKKQTAEINVKSYGLDPETFHVLLQELINNSPELFFVKSNYNYSATSTLVYTYLPHYKYTGDELQNRISSFNGAVGRIASYASQATTTVGKLMILNDYFCTRFQYDTSYSVYSPDELFTSGKGVCQAYMLGYKAVLDRLGISSTAAVSPKGAMNHSWNMVNVNGSWYHVDVTWNDPTSDMPLRAMHKNFLRSDSGIADTGHYGWTSAASASSTKYDNAFWLEVHTPVSVVGDRFYYISQNFSGDKRTVMAWREGVGTDALLTFSAARSDGAYISSKGYTPVVCNGDRLFYVGGNNVYSIGLNGGEAALEYAIAEDVFILTANLNGDTMGVYAAPASNLNAGTVHRFTVGYPVSTYLSSDRLDLVSGETGQMTANIGSMNNAPVEWTSSNEAVFTVDETGLVTSVGVGAAELTATYAGTLTLTCPVIVHAETALYLPEAYLIGPEALQNVKAQEIWCSNSTETISSKAFADCKNLLVLELGETVSSIAEDAFDGCEGLTLVVCRDSYAHAFAQQEQIPHVVVPPPAT